MPIHINTYEYMQYRPNTVRVAVKNTESRRFGTGGGD